MGISLWVHQVYLMKYSGLHFLESNSGKKYADTVSYLHVFTVLNIYKYMCKKYTTYNRKNCTLSLWVFALPLELSGILEKKSKLRNGIYRENMGNLASNYKSWAEIPHSWEEIHTHGKKYTVKHFEVLLWKETVSLLSPQKVHCSLVMAVSQKVYPIKFVCFCSNIFAICEKIFSMHNYLVALWSWKKSLTK